MLIIGLGAVLVLAIVITAVAAVTVLREREIATWKRQLETVTLILAGHASQTMVAGNGVLDDLADRIESQHVRSAAELRDKFAGPDTFRMLREKIKGIPQVDVATIVADNGDVINFSRSFPTPAINLKDRDYFAANLAGAGAAQAVSAPVRNKGNGKWTFYLSRRINDPAGQMIGLLLLGVSIDAFSEFYAPIGQNLGRGAAINLMRNDFVLLTRWPKADALIGEANRTGVSYELIANQHKRFGSEYTRSFRFSENAPVERIVATRVVDRYPLIVSAAATGDLFLAGWRQAAAGVAVVAGVCTLMLVGALSAVFRLQRRHESELQINRQLNASLRESEARANQIIESAPDAMVLVDAQGVILRLNARAEALLGYARDELVGQPIDLLVPDSLRGLHRHDREGYMRHAEPRPMGKTRDLHARRKDGSLLPAEISLAPMRLDGRLLVLASVVDVSDSKAMEAELRSHRDRLEEQVTERTAELVAARDEAQRLAQVKSRFLANMSHEIRTPLNAITGMAYLIRRSGLSHEQSAHLDKLEVAGDHLLQVINSILELSKIEAGGFTLAEVPVHVESLLESIVAMLHERVQDKRLTLRTRVVGPLPPNLLGDPTRLRQAMLNFAANALKFTESGHIELRVGLEQQDAESALLRFEVEDSGIGIAPEALPRLFAAFEQADNTMTRRYGGTGLGLAISKMLAQQMGGLAGATSTQGQGSTFWFSARLRKGTSARAPTTLDRESAAAVIRRDHAGSRILLVDDDPVNREIATALLNQVEQIVDTAEDGAQAVDMVRRQSYALILMDMQMPVMDGLQATRLIRTLPGGDQVPIVAITANAFAEDTERCQDAGMDDFLAKPLAPERLYETLLNWLHGNTRRDKPALSRPEPV